MSKGDKLFGIKTMYRSIQMRSKLEAKFAFFLDNLKIIWIYEPKTFLLSSGIMYKPDFYLPELNQWIEVKGNIEDHNKEISKQFVIDNRSTLILISSKDIFWYSYKDGNYSDEEYTENEAEEVPGIQLGCCHRCHKYFFCDLYGWWYCRNCKYHDGDGDADMICTIKYESFDSEIDISDIESINRFLVKNGVKLFYG